MVYSLIFPQMANLAYRASQFIDKKFLIIHPTADGTFSLQFLQYLCERKEHFQLTHLMYLLENVHFQHTAKFISRLISERANYTLQVRDLEKF